MKSGVFLSGEGLQPSSKGARVRFSGSKRMVTDGPFAETKELVGGYAILQFTSKAEAIEWAKGQSANRFVQCNPFWRRPRGSGQVDPLTGGPAGDPPDPPLPKVGEPAGFENRK